MRILKRHEKKAQTCLVVQGVTRAGSVGIGIYDKAGKLIAWGANVTAVQASYEQYMAARGRIA